MWTILKSLLIQGVLARTALRSLGWLAWLLPLGFLLKWVGLPLLAVLSVLALPVLVLLVAIGLPLFVVFLFGSVLMALVGTLLTVGIALAKVLIPMLLVVWLVRWLWGTRKPAPDVVTPSTSSPAT